MKGMSTLSSVVFALFLAAACADDDEPVGGNMGGGAGVGGVGGGSSDPACKYPYTDLTKSKLKAKTTSGACEADTDALCGANMVAVTGQCGVGCNAQSTDAATVAKCTKDCIQADEGVKPTLSDDCTNCYVADVGCSIQNCLTDCAAAPTGPACNACRLEKGCAAAFYECSGLPIPGSGSGGIGNGGGPGMGGSAGSGAGGEIAMGGAINATGGAAGETGSGGTGGAQ